ncbi:hypothetical protein GLX27_002448 [Malassezia furfur]|uniref:Membrane insertase YidC/Oxa/ALB C-terminal domain-containing protein n=1 Tax=Malassezia furfur TaxID=55194 RepID=A0ABY8EQB1_MALFU|nr:hypothetical protein CBS14141_000355 [Malassezia furfur]WFD47786.1 hypothetical protein GLX27_002448 [Malassezia furfur]
MVRPSAGLRVSSVVCRHGVWKTHASVPRLARAPGVLLAMRSFSLWGNSGSNEQARMTAWAQVQDARAHAGTGAETLSRDAAQAASDVRDGLASMSASLQNNASSASASMQDTLSSVSSSMQSGWASANASLQQGVASAKQGFESAKQTLQGTNASIENGLARADESIQSGWSTASQAGKEYAASAGDAAASAKQTLQGANTSIENGLARANESIQSSWASATKAGKNAAAGAGEASQKFVDSAREGTAEVASDAQGALSSIQDRLTHANHGHGSGILASESEAISQASQEATSELTAHGLGGWSPSGLLQHLLDTTQYLTHLPWWATIILVTCLIRLSVAPLLVYVQGNSIRLSNIQPQMQNMLKDLEYAKATGNQQEMQRAAVQVRKLLADNNCSPFRSLLLPAVQMPIFLSFYFALDGMARAKLPALVAGGFGWVPDLTVADPYYVLPITSAFMTLLVLETGAETGTTAMNQTKQARMVKNLLRGVTVLAAWFVSNFPAAVLLYWTTTNTFSLVQLLVLRTRFMKRLLKLPERVQHPVQPHVKQQSFMEGLRSGMASGSAHPNSAASARRPPPASLYKRGGERPVEADTRNRALDSMLSSKPGADKAASAAPTGDDAAAEKQSRLAAARERRLRQRN